MKLIDGSAMPVNADYLTLSHCWGKAAIMKPLGNQIEDLYRHEIPLYALTKTFRDAVRMTTLLGFAYLRIDAFCISQDKLLDWLEEALAMASIFSNAVLNLAATSAADGNGGLFPIKIQPLSTACVVKASWIGFPAAEYAIMDDEYWQRDIDDAVLNHCAWVLQERLLSPRVVHFGRERCRGDAVRIAATNPGLAESRTVTSIQTQARN